MTLEKSGGSVTNHPPGGKQGQGQRDVKTSVFFNQVKSSLTLAFNSARHRQQACSSPKTTDGQLPDRDDWIDFPLVVGMSLNGAAVAGAGFAVAVVKAVLVVP